MLPALGTSTLPGAPDAQFGGEGSDRSVARVQNAGGGLLPGSVTGDRARARASAVSCFEDDFEACIAHLRLPVTHRRTTRTTNLLERLFVEQRRRLKIIPNGFGEETLTPVSCSAR